MEPVWYWGSHCILHDTLIQLPLIDNILSWNEGLIKLSFIVEIIMFGV